MNSQEVQGALMQNQRLANAIGVQSTPSFVIGGEVISGAMELPGFEELISRAGKHADKQAGPPLKAKAADHR
jgi:protein-disulfide isomerase